MLPYIKIGTLELPMYGLCIVTGAILAVLLAMRRAKKSGVVSQDDLLYCIVYSVLGAMVGAKVLYIATSWTDVATNATYYFSSFSGFMNLIRYGFVFYGGLIGGLIVFVLYTARHRMDLPEMVRLVVPMIPLAHAVGRLGCFCAGCCYGIPMDPPWGLYFSAEGVAPYGVALFPVQLLESALNFILFIGLYTYTRKRRRAGEIMGLYLLCYAVERFILEFFRYDAERGIFLGISTSQWIGLLLIPLALILLFGKLDKLRAFYYRKWPPKTDGDKDGASETDEDAEEAEEAAAPGEDASEEAAEAPAQDAGKTSAEEPETPDAPSEDAGASYDEDEADEDEDDEEDDD